MTAHSETHRHNTRWSVWPVIHKFAQGRGNYGCSVGTGRVLLIGEHKQWCAIQLLRG